MTGAHAVLLWLHVLGATLLFGAGLGTAFHMLAAHLRGDARAIAVVSRNVVVADWLFIATSGVLQPLTGGALVVVVGHDPLAPWLVASYALYVVVALLWLVAVRLQLRMRALSAAAIAAEAPLPDAYHRCFRLWFIIGWPAFLALLAVFWLMVARPGS